MKRIISAVVSSQWREVFAPALTTPETSGRDLSFRECNRRYEFFVDHTARYQSSLHKRSCLLLFLWVGLVLLVASLQGLGEQGSQDTAN